MKPNFMIAIGDAVNDRRRTTEALSVVVDLLDHAGSTNRPFVDTNCRARAALLELFVEKMQANDDLLAGLVDDAAKYLK